MSEPIHPLVLRFIQDMGNISQSLGLGRVVGQTYAYLYFSPKPRNLADIQHALSVSRGSACTVVRQLAHWGAVRKVWVQGDRKDYYVANDWLGRVVRSVAMEAAGRKLDAFAALIDWSRHAVANPGVAGPDPRPGGADREFLESRVRRLDAFHGKVLGMWKTLLSTMSAE
jgi:hypothetical protein